MRDLIKVGCLALVLSLSLAAPVGAGPFEDVVAAYNRGDYATALRLWRPLADQGDAVAQANLGSMYDNGFGAILVGAFTANGRENRCNPPRNYPTRRPGGASECQGRAAQA